MAIKAWEFDELDDQQYKEIRDAVGELLNRLDLLREERLALELPVSGKLEAAWDKIYEGLSRVMGDDPGDDRTEDALEELNQLGSFLNLNIGPGAATLRDHLARQGKGQETRAKFENSLATIGRILRVPVGRDAAPRFNYRFENELRPEISPKVLRSRLYGPEPVQAEAGAQQIDRSNDLTQLAEGIRQILLKDVNGEQGDPKLEEKAAELLEWKAVISAIAKKDAAEEEFHPFIDRQEKNLRSAVTLEAALEKFRTGFVDFLEKGVTLNGQSRSMEERLLQRAPNLKAVLPQLKAIADPRTLQPGDQLYRADRRLRALMDPIRAGQKEMTKADLAEILAVRLAAGAARDDLDGLKRTNVGEEQIRSYKEELLKNPMLEQFFQTERERITALASQKRTHDGALEDQFKSFLVKRPAGELRNDPILARWMPSYGQRIEALKPQAKSEGGINRVEAMAEIVTLRGMAKADRHRINRLQERIRTDSGCSLVHTVRLLADDRGFQLSAEAAKDYAQHGHGGKLAEEIRKNEKRLPGDVQPNSKVQTVLNRTTYDGRVSTICLRANQMLDGLKAGRTPDSAMKLEYREMCIEFFALSEALSGLGEARGKDVDWSLMNTRTQVLEKLPRYSLQNTKLLTAEDMMAGLEGFTDPKSLHFDPQKGMPLKLGKDNEPRRDSLIEIQDQLQRNP